MARIKVINKGHNDTLLCDYNGQRYAFPKEKPVEISSEVYNFIMRSGTIDAMDLQVYQDPEGREPDIPDTPEKEISKPELKKKGKK